MSPILDKAAIGGSCPCSLQDKFYYWLIDPLNYGYTDMVGWSIDNVDFIVGANTVMQGYGSGSGIAVHLGYWNFGPTLQGQKGFLAFHGKFDQLPKPIVKDPFGNIIDPAWSNLYGGLGGICDQGYSDFPTCVHYIVDKVQPYIRYIETYWYDMYMWNTNTGYGAQEGVPYYYIDFAGQYGSDIDLASDPLAATKIKTVLDGMFLNNTSVTISASGPNHYDLFISKIYCNRSGFYQVNTNKWQDGERDTVSCI